jgi:branched-chain amino acid transport system substrate-binding protein
MFRRAIIWLACLLAAVSTSAAEPLEIFIDADFSKSTASATSITLGVRTALDEVGHRIGGQDVILRSMDHRGNVKRSFRHMQDLQRNENALLMIGGMQSPSYLTHRDFINENRLLTLLPWSAAGPITRAAEGRENWIFRLSVDDTKSGRFLADAAVTDAGCESISLLLLDTGWGKANHGPLVAALDAQGIPPQSVNFFANSIGEAAAGTLAERLSRNPPECIIMLSNWQGGALLVNALHQHLPEVRLFSHWGIMGGAFSRLVPHEVRNAHGLSVLQTCGLRREQAGNQVLRAALSRALESETGNLADLPAPTGFVHGYDLTRVLIAAAGQAATTPGWSGTVQQKRMALKTALEQLHHPVEGILKTYSMPFAPYTAQTPDAHEALGLGDMCLARFNSAGQLVDMH